MDFFPNALLSELFLVNNPINEIFQWNYQLILAQSNTDLKFVWLLVKEHLIAGIRLHLIYINSLRWTRVYTEFDGAPKIKKF